MGWGRPDVYSQPEKFGLELIGTIQWEPDSYSFDLTAVFRDKAGTLYWADDSGCSCPSPFEDYTRIEQLTKGMADQLQEHLELAMTTWEGDNWTPAPRAAVADLMLKVRNG